MEQAFLQRLQAARPRLAAKARLQTDKVSGEPVLLYPEGVVLLNGPGEAITQLCDGKFTFPEMLALLAERYHTTASEIARDVSEFLFTLHQQSLLELREEQERQQ
jgi:coenzyme PQQ biosynthesis protein PqqD